MFLFSFLLVFSARAAVYITVSGGTVRKANLAVGRVHLIPGETTIDPGLSRLVAEQLQSDLEFTNLFEFLRPSLFVQWDSPQEINQIQYDNFASIGSAFALKVGYKVEDGKIVLEAYLHDVPGRKKIFSTRYQYPASQYARVVHALTEDILKELTGEQGLFMSRIVMICKERTRSTTANKEVFIADPDGQNFTQVTFDNTLTLSPSWAADSKHISYTQFDWARRSGVVKKMTVLKKHNLLSGERRVISAREGMNSGAAWSPKGKKIAATLSFSGRPEIYFLDVSGRGNPEPLSRFIQWRRLSGEGFQSSNVSQLFDVEPNWSPDGNRIVFSSARTGHPMIYVVDLNTKVANQLTFAGQYNASPSWSPKGDKIVFSAQRTGEGNFDLYLIDPDGNNLSRLTSGDSPGKRFNNENANWAPTGRHLVYTSNEGGTYGVYVMTVDGTFRRKISPSGKECTEPSWSPYEG